MPTDTVAQAQPLSERIRTLLPSIAARATEAERLRRVPDENIAELHDAGYLNALVPARFGGSERSPGEVAEATRLLAGSCTSTAWTAQLLAVHAHTIANYSPQLQEEIWGANPHALVCSSVAPIGKGEVVDGGIRLTGRYSWSSGSQHADWAMLGLLLPGPEGTPDVHLAVVPRSDYTIEDVWYSMGLKGTGSQDLIIDDVFVPDYRIESMTSLNSGGSRGFGSNSAAVYGLPFAPVFAIGFSAIGLGAAEAIRDLYKNRLSSRVRAYTGAKVIESTPALMRLAETEHELRTVYRLLKQDWDNLDTLAESRRLATADELIDWRTNQSYATKMCVRAADRLFEASGGAAVRDDNPMQRFWRDIHTGAAHAYSDYDVAAQTLGANLARVSVAGIF
jgi:4-hydroxyphenylacetate 3-monooxygenase